MHISAPPAPHHFLCLKPLHSCRWGPSSIPGLLPWKVTEALLSPQRVKQALHANREVLALKPGLEFCPEKGSVTSTCPRARPFLTRKLSFSVCTGEWYFSQQKLWDFVIIFVKQVALCLVNMDGQLIVANITIYECYYKLRVDYNKILKNEWSSGFLSRFDSKGTFVSVD